MAFSLSRHQSLLGIGTSEHVPSNDMDHRTVIPHKQEPLSNLPNINTSLSSSADHETISDGGAFVSVELPSNSVFPETIEVSTSAILHYCKRRVLLPYFRLLALLGWRPLLDSSNESQSQFYVKFFNIAYTLAVLVFILIGYVLQYAACFRRDGYQCYKQSAQLPAEYSTPNPPYSFFSITENKDSPYSEIHKKKLEYQPHTNEIPRECEGSVVFLYIVPNILHFIGYIYAFCNIRNSENEQLQAILERVFLQSSTSHSWHMSQRKVIRRLRTFLLFGLCWLLISFTVQVFHVISEDSINFTWIKPDTNALKVTLICVMLIGIMWFDIICVAVVMIYCVHCQLLQSYIVNLCARIRESTLSFQDFIKSIEESKKILNYVNDVLATGTSFLLIIFASNASTGIFNVFSGSITRNFTVYKLISGVGSLILWLSILSFPVIQAVRLSTSLCAIKQLAQEIRSRPFGYMSTLLLELDSFLLYTSTLNLKARFFRVPVTYAFILALVTGAFYLLIVLGQVNVVKFTS